MLRRLLLLIVLASLATSVAHASRPAVELPDLGELLQRLERVAGLYRDAALRFTCDEDIHYTAPAAAQELKFRYIYRYSAETGMLGDYRELRGRAERGSDEKQERARLQNYGLPNYLTRTYSWIFIFEEQNQPLHHFEILGTDRIMQRDAILLSFEASPPFLDDRNEFFGTMWIDRRSYQLLRVDAHLAREFLPVDQLQRVREGTHPAQETLQTTYTFSEVTTEFDVEKNGMRFPGLVVIERNTYQVTGRKRRKAVIDRREIYRVVQTYGNYRFFGVRTAEQIEGIVGGD